MKKYNVGIVGYGWVNVCSSLGTTSNHEFHSPEPTEFDQRDSAAICATLTRPK
jgi:hypothetical protein